MKSTFYNVPPMCNSRNHQVFELGLEHPKEFQKFAIFTQSLLTRSSKLQDLIGQLESELGDKGPETTEGKRVAKPQT